MTEQDLQAELKAVSDKFDQLAEEKKTKTSDWDTEMARLQGEYRALDRLISAHFSANNDESDPAATIAAEPKTGARRAK